MVKTINKRITMESRDLELMIHFGGLPVPHITHAICISTYEVAHVRTEVQAA